METKKRAAWSRDPLALPSPLNPPVYLWVGLRTCFEIEDLVLCIKTRLYKL